MHSHIEILKFLDTICWDSNRNRLVPKRSLAWIQSNYNSIYESIINLFPDTKLGDIHVYIKTGIYNISMIPKCRICDNKVHVYQKNVLEYCSNKCTIKSSDVQNKTKNTCIEKYGTERKWGTGTKKFDIGTHYLHKNLKNISSVNDRTVMVNLQNNHWTAVADHFGLTTNSHSSSFNIMKRYGYPIKSISGTSKAELDVAKFIQDLGFDVITNTRKLIAPYEIDIYIPEKNLAIEFNGLYWHSSYDKESDKNLKNYHLDKTEKCESIGISLLHIFESEWNDNQLIWKSMIKHRLGLSKKVFARKCIVRDITVFEANEFCINNHLQGRANASFAKGLYYNDELVQVATFSKPRYNKNYDLELIRLCSKIDLCIVGGASKLTKGLSFISYGNRRWCSNLSNVYDSIAIRVGISDPCYWYIKNGTLYHRSSFMKHKLKNVLDIFDPNLTEAENCFNNKLRRIWDCGNLIYKTS